MLEHNPIPWLNHALTPKEQGRNQHQPLSPRRYHFSFEIADRLEGRAHPSPSVSARIRTRAVARIRMMKRCSGQGNLTYDILKASRPIVGVCWNVAMSDGFCVGLAAHYIWPGTAALWWTRQVIMRVETSMRARAVPRCGCSSTGPRGPGCVGARGGVLRRRVGSQDNLVIPVFFRQPSSLTLAECPEKPIRGGVPVSITRARVLETFSKLSLRPSLHVLRNFDAKSRFGNFFLIKILDGRVSRFLFSFPPGFRMNNREIVS